MQPKRLHDTSFDVVMSVSSYAESTQHLQQQTSGLLVSQYIPEYNYTIRSTFISNLMKTNLPKLLAAFIGLLLSLSTFSQTPATALNTDGVNDYVAINNPFRAFQKEITVEFWMNTPNTIMPYGSIMGQSTSGVDNMSTNVWLMHPDTKGNIDFLVNDGGVWKGVTVALQTGWHHYVGVASEFGVRFYVDGVLAPTISGGPGLATGITNGIVNNGNSVIHIGKDVRHNTGRFGNITIDEVRIWSRVLCQEEIQNNMNCELNPVGQDGLQEYYRFNQGFAGADNSMGGTILNDLSGNNRDGTLIGFALSGNTSNWVQSGFTSTNNCTPYVAPISPITGATTLCTGGNTTLANTISGGLWSSSNTAVATINRNTGVVNAISAGSTTITYRTECGGVATTTFIVNAIPSVTIAAVGGTTGCPSSGVTLNATAPNGSTYQWFKNGVLINGASGVSYNATSSGSYTAVATNSGCVSTVSNAVAITISDATPPTITCPGNKVLASCDAVIPDYTTSATATDNCTASNSIVITQSPVAGTPIASGATVTVTLTARDASNNTNTCNFTVNRPNITPVAVDDNATVCAGGSVNISVLNNDTHPQGLPLTISDNAVPSVGTLVKNANNTFTYTAPVGYSGPVTFTYTTKANDGTQAFSGNGHYYEFVSAPGISWTAARAAASARTFNGLQGYLVTITSAAENAFMFNKVGTTAWIGGSDAAQEGVWRWVDGPEAGQQFSGQNKTGDCSANVPAQLPNRYHNWAPGEPNDCGGFGSGTGAENYAHFRSDGLWNDFPNGASVSGYAVEYGGLENCLPQLTATATVTIQVTLQTATIAAVGGTSTCPGNSVTLNASASAGSTYQWFKDAVVIPNASNASYQATATGSYTAVVTNNGCVSAPSNAITITVADAIKPTITCPTNQTLNLDATCKATLPDYRSLVTVSDNCTPTGSLVITQSPAPGTIVEGRGGFFVTISVRDASNNEATCTMPVDKIDVTKPVINCPAPITVNNTTNTCGATVTYSMPTATDNCSGPAFNFWNTGSGEPNNANVAGEDYLELMANGRWNDLPNANMLRSIVEFNDVRNNTYTGYTRMGTFEGHTYYLSTTTATWQNSRIAAQGLGADMVSINTIAENDFLYQYLAANGGGVAWAGGYQDRNDAEYAEPGTPTQNFGGWKWTDGTRLGASQVVITQIAGLPSGSVFPFGSTVNTFRATDQSGNSIVCSFTVTVRDNQPPVMTCTAPIVVNNAPNTCGAVVTFTSPTATDNCGTIPFTSFRGGEPNQFQGALQDYLQLYTDGTWDDLQNTSLNKWIVEFNKIITTSFPGYTRIGEFGGHTYYVSTSTATWINARVSAQSIGGDLVSINTQAENSFVASSGIAWVGGYQDLSDSKYIEPGNASQNYGGWKWVDGTSMSTQKITITQTAGLPSGSVFPVGITTNTFIARDESGNESTCSFTVTVRDVQPPVISCPANINVTATSAAGAVVNYTTPVGTDNCSGAITERIAGPASGSTFPIGITTVTHRVTDAAGLSTECSFTVTVSGLAPVIVSPGNQTVNVAPGTCAAVVNFAATETTGIPASTISYSIPSGSTFGLGSTVVTATATNAVGSSFVEFTVSVVDNEKPVITTCPPNQTINLDASCKATLSDYRSFLTASDNCTPANELVITQSPAAGAVVNDKGDLIVTFTVTDASGNNSTCTITVTKKDVTAPVITCTAPITVNNTPNTCGAVVNFINPTATDNCTGGAFNFWSVNEPNNYQGLNEDYVQLYNNGTWNDLPNSSLNRWIVEFNDIRSNVYSGYKWIGTHGGHTYYYSSASATWTNARAAAQSIGGDLASINTLAESTFLAPYGGTTWVGGYQDKTVPGFQEPGNASQNYLGWKWVDGTQLGAGQIVITQTAGLPSGSVFPVGVTTNTFIARDESGNESTCSFTVTVRDVQPPVISCTANINVTATSAAGAVVNYTTPVGTDNCSGATTVRISGLASGSTFPIGTTTVTYRVTDAAGLSTQCSFTVTVVGVAPVISCPANITVNAAAGTCAANVNFAATETVGIPASTITYTINGNPVVSGASFPVGTTTVVATATNAVGSSNCSFTVTVVDNQNPTITAPANVQGNNTAGLCTGTVTLGAPATGDNCGVASVTNDAPTTGIFPVGSTTVTWTVTDIHGNKATATQTVVIVDNEKPTISVTSVNVNNDAGKCGASVTIAPPITADNCDIASVVGVRSDNASLSAEYPVGTTTITWKVTDIHGNDATTTQTVVVNDTELPVVKTNNIVVQLGANGQASITTSQINNGSTDNCAIASIVLDKMNFNCSNVGENTVLLTVTDIHGNIASANATVTVQDNILPTVITQPVTVTLVNGAASVTAAQINNGSFDNCGIATMTVSPANFNCNNIGSNTVILTVTDVNGNTNTRSAIVTVVGQLPSCSITSVPTSNVFTGGNPNNIYLGYGAQSTVLNVAATGGSSYTYQWSGTATQMLSSTTVAAPVFTPTAPGNYTFTVTVTNNFGCTSTCTITICVKDIRVPGTGLKGSPAKVYICHVPPGNPNNPQTLEISVNAVATHIGKHGGDRLGTCAMTPCAEPAPTTVSNALISKAVVEGESKASTNEELKVTVMPNPSATYFTLKLESKYDAPVNMKVVDVLGRVVDNRMKLGSNATVEVGHNYQSGTYFAEFIQGNRRKVVQLLKIKR